MKTLDNFSLSLHVHDTFRLDGGSMFGSVPKNLWSKIIPVDDENCIPLCCRSLLISQGARTFLIETGNGDKFPDKLKKIFAIEATSQSDLGFSYDDITDVILTHLHFDHAGGVSYYQGDTLALRYPSATHWVQRSNFENAKNPNPREQASYLPENVDILEQAQLELLEDGQEIHPGISVHVVDGHTTGLQWIKLTTKDGVVAFPSDLIPTSRHLPLPYIMGYDICAGTSMEEKARFLEQALKEKWIIVFGHDPDVPAATIKKNERGHYAIDQIIDF